MLLRLSVPRSPNATSNQDVLILRLLPVLTILVALRVPFALVVQAQDVATLWEQPTVLFDAGQSARVFSPLVVEDSKGRMKVLWEVTTEMLAEPGELANGIYCIDGDGTNWSTAVDVIVGPDGGRTFWPRHAMDGYGRLHLIWVDANGRLHYSRTASAQACDARSWETVVLPALDQVLHGSLAVDDQGTLHVAYSGRGKDVYHMRSIDDGLTWTDPVAISSVPPNVTTSFPELAVDLEGRIHVVWEQDQLPAGVPSLGLFYARSQDEGQTWSSPLLFSQAEGQYTQPNVATLEDGTLHLLWNGKVGTFGRYHQWSTDGGATWSSINEFISRNMGGGQTGPPNWAVDSAGRLHVVTGTDDTTYAAWYAQKWLPAYDIASFETAGNLEDQNITVAQGRFLYTVANSNLQKIILIRGVTDAPAAVPEFQELPTLPPPSPLATVSPTEQPRTGLSPNVTPLGSSLTGSPPPANSLFPVLLGFGLAFLVVAAVVVINVARRRS